MLARRVFRTIMLLGKLSMLFAFKCSYKRAVKGLDWSGLERALNPLQYDASFKNGLLFPFRTGRLSVMVRIMHFS
ncbi:uncharacterized protein BDZ99DRAFT_81282 [Mytilinidion resinicola]|uniref:Secreted protein n=1 Tax=Mytilinidion resinicola TaxID=574789 RepID=A0A6A6YG95_9PEZI|nr:uncharacterized protein BDZ99DRAFT_81282 [Mytilinidion resinicola]KAF2807553.1 hypothetical protein BDZ99DRAFT_81282 [Mytilinidion resinicola]